MVSFRKQAPAPVQSNWERMKRENSKKVRKLWFPLIFAQETSFAYAEKKNKLAQFCKENTYLLYLLYFDEEEDRHFLERKRKRLLSRIQVFSDFVTGYTADKLTTRDRKQHRCA